MIITYLLLKMHDVIDEGWCFSSINNQSLSLMITPSQFIHSKIIFTDLKIEVLYSGFTISEQMSLIAQRDGDITHDTRKTDWINYYIGENGNDIWFGRKKLMLRKAQVARVLVVFHLNLFFSLLWLSMYW